MKFIKLRKINKKFLIPVFGGVVVLIYRIFINKIPKYDIIDKNPFLINIYISLGMFFAFIPNLILKHRIKTTSFPDTRTESKLHSEIINNEKSISYQFLKLILYSTIFDFLQILLSIFFSYECIYNLWFFDILFMSLFSYMILKTKLYRHQYFSIIIIIIFGFILNIIEYFKLDNNDNKLDFFKIFMKFLCEICLSIGIVIIKYNMDKTYCTPYEICCFQGLFGLILNIIVLVIINTLGVEISHIKYPNNFYELFDNYDIYDFIICFIIIIVYFVYNIVLLITCDYFTPFHILITSIIKECYNYLQLDENTNLNILGFFILVIIAFMFLVFIEIIEINVCNISYNTKNNIETRALIDSIDDIKSYIFNPNDEALIELNTLLGD